LFQRKLNKKGKPSGKPVLVGYEFEFSSPVNPSAAGNTANYQVDTATTQRFKKKDEKILHSFTNVHVSYVAETDWVTLTLASKQTFPTGGQIAVLGGSTGGISGSSDAALGGNTTFTISKGGKTIGPART
jgi:hypothetical protein